MYGGQDQDHALLKLWYCEPHTASDGSTLMTANLSQLVARFRLFGVSFLSVVYKADLGPSGSIVKIHAVAILVE
jgi:hypothetical protein